MDIYHVFVLGITLIGCSKAEIDVDAYLSKYNYMGRTMPSPGIAELIDVNMTLAREMALSMFQRKFGLPVTGRADSRTLNLMATPRCSIPDILGEEDIPDMSSEEQIAQPYVLQGSRWPSNDLTYKIISYSSDLRREEIDDTIARAFQVWGDVSTLTFRPVSYNDNADINIQFKDVYQYGYDFDGPGGALAYAYFPQYGGDTHFDDGELWTLHTAQGSNLFQIAAHEFGHALGLAHSYDYTALMYPYYLGYVPSFRLPYDDIIGIQSIYGYSRPETQAPPYRTTTTTTTTTTRPTTTTPRRRPTSPRPTTTRPTIPRPTTPRATSPPGYVPEFCYDAHFDDITTQKIGDRVYTIVFRNDSYYALNEKGGIAAGYPQSIRRGWKGARLDNIDAVLTPPWTKINNEWRYMEVTYLFKGDFYYKMVNMEFDGNQRNITSDFGIPGDLDAVFQWYSDGKFYFIKGDNVYRFSSFDQRVPDKTYPQSISSLNRHLYAVDAAFMALDSKTYFFREGMHVRFLDHSFQIESGYPKLNSNEWLKCNI